MKPLKLLVMLAGLTGLVFWSSAKSEASGCCRYDCDSAYCTMISSGVPAGDAEQWRTQCRADCDAHGTPDPSYCPVIYFCPPL